MSENQEGIDELTCDMCKISYVTEKELKDHEWSLMHHIKVEQKKKGSIHKCTLCFTTCPNLIEYGKHLNGDKHKQAIEESRVQSKTLDPQEIQSRLQSGEKEVEQEEQQEIRVENNYNKAVRSHQRSNSQPQFRGQFFGNRGPSQPPFRGQFFGNRRPSQPQLSDQFYENRGNRPSQFYEYEEGYTGNYDSFENPYWHRGGMRQMFPYQWRQPWESTSPDPWEHPNQVPEDMDFQYQEQNIKEIRQPENQYSDRGRNEKNKKNFRQSENQYSDRGRNSRYEFIRPEKDYENERLNQERDKRRMETDKNKKNVRFEDESEETSGYSSQPQISQESISTKRRKRNSDVTEIDQSSESGRTTKNSKSRSHDPPVVEADSTTDIEMSTRRTTIDIEKKLDGKKKTAAKVKKKKTGSKGSPRSEEEESVLERAEKLCKELRDKREKAKKELNSKEKEKKIEKNSEINRQLKKFAEINKSYVKGKLEDSDDSSLKQSTVVSTKTTTTSSKSPVIEKITQSPAKVKDRPSTTSSSSAKFRNVISSSPSRSSKSSNKPKEASPIKSYSSDIDVDSSDSPVKQNTSKKSKGGKRKENDSPSRSKTRDINEIRREIELEVQQSQIEHNKSFDFDQDKVVVKEENSVIFENKKTPSEDLIDESSKTRSVIDSTSRESLLKMVNSPRSRKERQQLAEVLRTYAKSQNRLSLPRFNLHMSGLYDSIEHYGDFRLEELSPEVQLQIAELIEADIKPDIDDLEKSLLPEVKIERTDDVGYSDTRLSRSSSVDRLELLDKSLNQSEKTSEKMNSPNKLRFSSCVIKQEPLESPVRLNYPQSPQYSQEEREFIDKFCAPGSPVKNQQSESQSKSPQQQTQTIDKPDKQAGTYYSPYKHKDHTEIPDIANSDGTSSLYSIPNSPIILQIKSEDSPVKTSTSNFSFRKRSNSLSNLHTITGSGFSDSLRSNPEMQRKHEKLTESLKNGSFTQSLNHEKLTESLKNGSFTQSLNHEKLTESVKTGSFTQSLNHEKLTESVKTGSLIQSLNQQQKEREMSEQLFLQSDLDNQRSTKTLLTMPGISSDAINTTSSHRKLLEENKVRSPLMVSQVEPVKTSMAVGFTNDMSPIKLSQTEPTISTENVEKVYPSFIPPSWFGNEGSPYKISHNEPFRSVGSEAKIQPSSTVSQWFNSGISSSRTTQNDPVNSTSTGGMSLTHTGSPSTMFGRTTQTEPFYTVGTTSTTVTTWSSSSGYLTQPQVMSSSEMSSSNVISQDVRMRHPSESSTAESLVDTVYDISIKEEDTRQELMDVDQNISRLQKLIEESTVELNNYKDRRLKLKKEEQNLRSRRINVLQEARDKHRKSDFRHESDMSDRPTPPLSATEDYGMSSGGKMRVPSSVEDSLMPQVLRQQRIDHHFANPLYPASDPEMINAAKSRSFSTVHHEDHGIPAASCSKSVSNIEPYMLKGMQVLNTLQSKSGDHAMTDSPGHKQFQSESLLQMMPPPSVSPVKMGLEVGVPHLHTMSPGSQGSPSPNQRVDQLKDNNQIKVSGIHYHGTSVPSSPYMSAPMNMSTAAVMNISSAVNVSAGSPVHQKQISEFDRQTDISTSRFSDMASSSSERQMAVHDSKIVKKPMIVDSKTTDSPSEDIIMMSDEQKHGDCIIINDSPKRSLHNIQSQHSTWEIAEKPDSESQETQTKSSQMVSDSQKKFHYEKQSTASLKPRHDELDVVKQSLSPRQPSHTDDKQYEKLSTKNIEQYDSESIPKKEDIDISKSTDLKSLGFVTLSNLMDSASQVHSPRKDESERNLPKEEPRTQVENEVEITSPSEERGRNSGNDRKERYIQHEKSQREANVSYTDSEEDINPNKSDNEKSDSPQDLRDRVNVQYMGSVPSGIGRSELLRHFKSGKDDRMSYLVVDDQNKDMYEKLQLLFTKPPSGSSHLNKDDVVMDLDGKSDSGLKDSNSMNSNSSLGEKIRQYCKQNKPETTEPYIMLSDDDQKDNVDLTVRENQPPEILKERSTSPFRKRLKTKKERDRASIRKQKEGCILDSSSDYNSAEEESTSKHKYKGGQKSKQSDIEIISDHKESEVSQDIKLENTGLIDRVPDDDVIPHKLLEEVQLETESDDSRINLKDKFSDRFKLKPDFLASLKAAVQSSLSKDEPIVEKPVVIPDHKVQCHGPHEQVSGIQVVGQHIYVSYIGTSVRKYHRKTGELLHTFDCSPHQISCLFILKANDSLKLYTGGSSQHLLSFNASTGQLLRSENLEEKLQCFHHNWGKLFIGTYTGSILVWSTKTDRNIDAYVCSDRPISCISSATEGAQKVILVAAYDSTVFVLSATSGLLIRILEGHTKTVFSLQVDGSIVFSGSGDKTVIEHNLQTGDMTWTYTQAAGIITIVCVYEDLLFCASFDKFIRCYTREDHKLKSLYYGADRGLVTQMAVVDDKIVTGNRNGMVEVVPINSGKETACQFEGCSYVFGVKHHLLYHLMSDHMTSKTKVFHCQWKGCKNLFTLTEGEQQKLENHMKGHILQG